MSNSLIILSAFVGFLAFGYLSLLRIMLKNTSLSQAGIRVLITDFRQQSLANLGSSAFFVSLPATSLLLFWGWGPALLWLLIFHLFAESLFQIQYSDGRNQHEIADHLLRANNQFDATLEQGLIQAFFLLLMSSVTALLASLIDTQSGLLFALLFLLPARHLLRSSSPALSGPLKIIGCALLIALGITFSDKLGFSIYGNWAPLGDSFDWLRFNNPTVIAAVLIIATFQLDNNEGFKKDISSFAGAVIALLIISALVRLLWLNPSLDAPLNLANAEQLPSFIGVSLFIFAGLAALLIRLLNDEQNQATQSQAYDVSRFIRLQNDSLVQLIFMLVLVLSLAAALGIGAWKTHYINWDASLNLLDHLNLAISSTVSLIHSGARSGTLSHTILLASLCLTGFSFMLMCSSQLSLEDAEKETLLSVLVRSKAPQAILIFLLSAYFIGNGVRLNTWLIIGMLAWVLVTHLSIGLATQSVPDKAPNSTNIVNRPLAMFCISLVIIGSLQTIWLCIAWAIDGVWLYCAISALLLMIAGRFWLSSLISLSQSLKQGTSKNLF